MSYSNWAGNFDFRASRWVEPQSLDALQECVARVDKIRAVGTRHSFSRVADSVDALVSLENFDRLIDLNPDEMTVTVEAGIRYGELCRMLDREGFALHNLASLVHIGVAGACATATHGSGTGNLSTAVSGLELINADGEVVTVSRSKKADPFDGFVVALGGLGVVTKVTLDIVPAFQVSQVIYEDLPFATLESHFQHIMSSAYSVSLFTTWRVDVVDQVWLKHKVVDGQKPAFPASFFGAIAAQRKLHPVPGFPAESCTEQLGVPGPWHERLQHFKLDFTPSAGDELQAEYLLPIENAIPALQAVNTLREEIAPLLHTSEIRTVAADELWMSTAYRQNSIAIHFTWKPIWPKVKACLAKIESELVPLGARPHWGKLFTLSPEQVQSKYEKLTAFRELLNRFDSGGKFRNSFLNRYICQNHEAP